MNATVITATLVLALSFTITFDEAHSVTPEPPAVVVEGSIPNSLEEVSIKGSGDQEGESNATGSQKGYAYIHFSVFGFERSLTDLASKLTLKIDYKVVEDGWFQDKAEYTVTGKVVDIEKFYSTIQPYSEKFQLEKEPLN